MTANTNEILEIFQTLFLVIPEGEIKIDVSNQMQIFISVTVLVLQRQLPHSSPEEQLRVSGGAAQQQPRPQ